MWEQRRPDSAPAGRLVLVARGGPVMHRACCRLAYSVRTDMRFGGPPQYAAWQHRDARNGFEVVFLRSDGNGWHLEGHTAAVEHGEAWVVHYRITLDRNWLTRTARVTSWDVSGPNEVTLEGDGGGAWRINGEAARDLDGCLDVDLEASALTNAFPVHRLGLEIGQEAYAPAAYVRAADLRVERLEQRYMRMDDDAGRERYNYTAPGFDFESRLLYDASGLVLEYPGIAVRAV